MPCYHPLKAWPVGVHDSGKTKYKITGYDVDYVTQRDPNGSWICCRGSPERTAYTYRLVTKSQDIPCGKCIGCRLDYSRQWADRCMLELQYHDSSYFVTLTYDDDHLPHGVYEDDDGCFCTSDTLRPRDLQLFFKLLRKYRPNDNIRYFACGEYGDDTARPHYHAVIFGLHLDDLEFYRKSELGYNYYNSKLLSDAWRDCSGDGLPRGHVVVGEVTWETCAYTARYVAKKLNGKLKETYENFALVPEFARMSRRPGIASQYFEDHADDIYRLGSITYATESGGKTVKPPRYFDRKYDLIQPEQMQFYKDHRKELAAALQEAKLQQTNLNYLDMLAVAERSKQASISALSRRGDCCE